MWGRDWIFCYVGRYGGMEHGLFDTMYSWAHSLSWIEPGEAITAETATSVE
jgi:hypothetical protein